MGSLFPQEIHQLVGRKVCGGTWPNCCAKENMSPFLSRSACGEVSMREEGKELGLKSLRCR